MIRSAFRTAVFIIVSTVLLHAHAPEGDGAALQLFSNRLNGAPPKIDGAIDGAWSRAAARQIVLTDKRTATLLFMNDEKSLFIGVVYDHADDGGGNGVALYFDEGGNMGLLVDDGSHDDELSCPEEGSRNEDAVRAVWNGGKVKVKNMSWDGKGWKTDGVPSAGLEAAAFRSGKTYMWEFKIPLNSMHDDNRDVSDLDVGETDEIGLFIAVTKEGEGKGTFYWEETNRDPESAGQGAGWADLRLGLAAGDRTLYAANNVGGAPVVDGNITSGSAPDEGWKGAYRRDIVLSNFSGSKIPASIFITEDAAKKKVYVGLKVTDQTESARDYCVIYQEENNITPAATGNALLDPDLENGLYLSRDSTADLYWDGGRWRTDTKTPANQKMKSLFYPVGEPHYEMEFEIATAAGKDDLSLSDGAVIGFMLKYHDENLPAGRQDFFWEMTGNVVSLKTDTATAALAAGWARLQTGAPSLQVVSPRDKAQVGGGYVLRVYAGKSPVGKNSTGVKYKVLGEESWKDLSQVAGSDEWTTVWKTDSKPDGDYTLVFTVNDEVNNTLITRYVDVEVKNARSVSVNPTVSVGTPRAGDVVYGASYIVNFRAQAVAGKKLTSTQFAVDGGKWSLTTSATSHTWNTTKHATGAHFVRIRVTDSDGVSTVSEPILVHVNNQPPVGVADVSPAVAGNLAKITFRVRATRTDLSVRVPKDQLQILDSGAKGDLLLADQDADGVYTAVHTISAQNKNADGVKNLFCLVTDPQANSYKAACSVELDNKAPVISEVNVMEKDTAYHNGEQVSLTVRLDPGPCEITADFSRLDDRYITGAEQVERVNKTSFVATYRIAADNGREDGPKQVVVTATDPAGHAVRKSIDILLDNAGPVVTAAGVQDADRIINADDAVTATVKDGLRPVARVEYAVDAVVRPGDGTEMKAVRNGYEAALPVAALSQGPHTVWVRARDLTGNWGAAVSHTFTKDTAGPVISAVRVTYPAGQTALADGQTVTVTAAVTDLTAGLDAKTVILNAAALKQGADKLVMTDDGKGADLAAGDGVFSAAVTPDQKTNGTIMVVINAADKIGNAAMSRPVPVATDNTAPVIASVKVASPDDIFRVGETVQLEVAADAAGYAVRADFAAADDQYRAGAETVGGSVSPYPVAYTLSGANTRTDGSYDIKITVTDAVGNSSSSSVKMTLDNHGPAVTAVTLKDADDILNADDVLTVTLKDATTALTAAEYFMDAPGTPGSGTGIAGTLTGPEGQLETGFTLKGLTEGPHRVFVHARDTAGSWGPLAALPFNVDRVPPVVHQAGVTYPDGQAAVTDGQVVVLTALVTDGNAGLDPATVILDASVLNGKAKKVIMTDTGQNGDESAGDGVFTARVTVGNGKSGSFPVTVTASDKVPNTCVPVTVPVTVDNNDPAIMAVTVMDKDNVFSNGQMVLLNVKTDAPGYRVSAGFGALDSRFIPGSEVAEVAGDTVRIAYRIHPDNRTADGKYDVTVTVTDQVGRTDSKKAALVLDNDGPAVNGLKLDDNDAVINAAAAVTAELEENEQPVAAAEYFIDRPLEPGRGTSLTAADGAFDKKKEQVKLTIDPATLPDGAHVLYLRGRNADRHWGALAALPFTVDRTIPAAGDITVTYPRGLRTAINGDTLSVAVMLDDAGTGLDPASVRLDASVLGGGKKEAMTDDGKNGDFAAGDNVYSARVVVKAKNSGRLPFTITAADRVPNGITLTGAVTVDAAAPQVKLVIPELGGKLKGKIGKPEMTVSGSYTDTDLVSLGLEVADESGKALPGTPLAVPVTAGKNFTYPLAGLAPGKWTVRVTAADRAGNRTVAEAAVTYEVPKAK